MKVANAVSLGVGLVFFGLCLPAHASLLGSNVDLRYLFPNSSTTSSDFGSTTVSAAVEYPNASSLSVDITAAQLVLGWPGPGSLGFTASAFNGFEFLFTGVTITGASVNGSSTFLGTPVVTVSGNNIFVNYSGVNTGTGPTTSIIDVTLSSSAVPEPGTVVLLGAGLLGLGFRYKRRFAPVMVRGR